MYTVTAYRRKNCRSKFTSCPFADCVELPFDLSVDEEFVLLKWNTHFLIFVRLHIVDRAVMSSREALNMKLPPIQSTAGAVPVRNEKGELVRLASRVLAAC